MFHVIRIMTAVRGGRSAMTGGNPDFSSAKMESVRPAVNATSAAMLLEVPAVQPLDIVHL